MMSRALAIETMGIPWKLSPRSSKCRSPETINWAWAVSAQAITSSSAGARLNAPLALGFSDHPVDAFQNRSGLEGALGQDWVLNHALSWPTPPSSPTPNACCSPNHRINFTLMRPR